jgi:hypothetical protein
MESASGGVAGDMDCIESRGTLAHPQAAGKIMSDWMYNAIGLMGPLLFTTAYAMTSIGKWDGTMVRLHLCNLVGAVAMLISLSHDWNLPIFLLEICWGAVAAYGCIKAITLSRRGNV